MLIEVEKVQEFPWSPFPLVQIQTPVGRTSVQWCGPRDVSPGLHHVEWTIDLPFAWGTRTRRADEPGPAIRPGGHCLVFRGRLLRTSEGSWVLDFGGSLIQVDFTGGEPPEEVDGSWVQLYVPHENIGLHPTEP
ncbi:hypothetical protein [Cryptosporangium sp. NPDC051539]|uniref:hypothetical protein n=1 Tax=Cryptosporangium sp. NPDC051539 TaxID=3363962 RepID=UPI00378EC06D